MQRRGADSRSCGQEIPELNGTQTASTLFEKAHWTLFRATLIQSTSPLYFSVTTRNLIILSVFRSNRQFSFFHLSLCFIFIHD